MNYYKKEYEQYINKLIDSIKHSKNNIFETIIIYTIIGLLILMIL